MVFGSSAFQASCVNGESPQTSRFYLSKETFLRYLCTGRNVCQKMTHKGTVDSCSSFRIFPETAPAWKFKRLESYLCQIVLKFSSSLMAGWRRNFIDATTFYVVLFCPNLSPEKKFGIVKEARNLLSFCGVVFRICQDPQNCLELFF